MFKRMDNSTESLQLHTSFVPLQLLVMASMYAFSVSSGLYLVPQHVSVVSSIWCDICSFMTSLTGLIS